MTDKAAYVIGIDGGTESLRAGVYDLSGNPIAYAATPYKTNFPQPGWAEQNPHDWWQATGQSVREAICSAGIKSTQVTAISVDTTCCSVVALDDKGQPLRPALIWMDVRSAKEADAVTLTKDAALFVNSGGAGPVSAEWMIPKALWLKRHEPEIYSQAAIICEYQDYLNYQLTGRLVASINNVAVRWHHQSGRGGFQTSMLEKLGLADLINKWPKEVLPLAEKIDGLTPRGAKHLGLQEGLPVAQGGADAFIGMIGLGVVRPGAMALLTGSSHLQLGLTDKAFHGKGIWGTYEDALLPGMHLVEGGQTSTGSIINWYKNLLGDTVSYDDLNHEAAKIAPGCDGLVVQDHFQGNRTPYTDPLSRGAFIGLSLKHGRGHLFRAIIESIAFGSELIFETMRANDYTADKIVVAGGATRSDLWLQIHADVSAIPLSLTKVADAPSLGCAILAAVCAGHYDSITEASDQMVSVERIIEPDMQSHLRYCDAYEVYKRAYMGLTQIREE